MTRLASQRTYDTSRPLDLDIWDFVMSILFPVYGLVMGLVLGVSHDFRREGAWLAGSAIVAVLVGIIALLII